MKKNDRRAIAEPSFLKSRRMQSARTRLRMHYTLPDDQRGVKRAPVDFELLNHVEVKSALQGVFGGSCAYCEDPMRHNGSMDHYRPIASADDGHGHTSSDHYGWFAYDWDNLLLLCEACQSAKRNLFPTKQARTPVLSSWLEAGRSEKPLLLDPCVDQPMRHLALACDGALVPRSERGEATIGIVNLNRMSLIDARDKTVRSILRAFSKYLSLGESDELLQIARDPMGPRSGATLLCLCTICDLLPQGSPRTGRSGATTFLRQFEALLSALAPPIWRAAVETYVQSSATVLRKRFLPDQLHIYDALQSRRRASARVRRIQISDFKGLEHLDLQMPSGTRQSAGSMMLLGENSTGKSTVLQAIYLALATPAQRRSLRIEPEDFISRERRSWKLIGDKQARILLELDSGRSTELVIDASLGLKQISQDIELLVLAYGAHRVFRRGRSTAAAAASRTLFDSLAPIPDPSEWLREVDDSGFKAVARALNEVLALKQDDHISRDVDGNVQVTAHGRTTPIERMSDGYRSLFSMAVDIMRNMVERWGNLEEARGVVLIDEVETHLHPRWKMQVMTALRRSMPQVQFIVTTHDPLCLRGMLNGEVQVLVRGEQEGVELLSDLPNVQGLRAEQLLTSEYFGLASTTDPEVESLLEEYANAASSQPAGSAEAKDVLDGLANRLTSMTLIGDEPAQQVLAEAMARFLSARVARPIDASNAREDAVRAVLVALDRSYGI